MRTVGEYWAAGENIQQVAIALDMSEHEVRVIYEIYDSGADRSP